MSYQIDKEKCIGCGLCSNLCAEIFELAEDGKAKVREGVDFEKNKECVKEAKESCPVGAIQETK